MTLTGDFKVGLSCATTEDVVLHDIATRLSKLAIPNIWSTVDQLALSLRAAHSAIHDPAQANSILSSVLRYVFRLEDSSTLRNKVKQFVDERYDSNEFTHKLWLDLFNQAVLPSLMNVANAEGDNSIHWLTKFCMLDLLALQKYKYLYLSTTPAFIPTLYPELFYAAHNNSLSPQIKIDLNFLNWANHPWVPYHQIENGVLRESVEQIAKLCLGESSERPLTFERWVYLLCSSKVKGLAGLLQKGFNVNELQEKPSVLNVFNSKITTQISISRLPNLSSELASPHPNVLFANSIAFNDSHVILDLRDQSLCVHQDSNGLLAMILSPLSNQNALLF